jgi:hypothetical protein
VAHELEALLTASARGRLLRGARLLALPARTVCLECRLDDDDRVDLALCLATHTAGLAPALETLGQKYAGDARWQRCIQLLVHWANGDDTSLTNVPFLYTAFDLSSEAVEMPVPCLSLCADPSFFMRRLGLPAPRASRDWPALLLDACSARLELDWVTEELRQRARLCLGAVEDLEVRQLSLMLARQPATLKFDLTLPTSELPGFLSTMGWGGDAMDVASQLALLAPWQRRVQLNFVVNSTMAQAPLEIELCCTGPDEPTPDERSALLERLVASGVASPAKAQSLRQLLHRPATVDASGRWVARNWYLKLRFDGGHLDSAKAYLGLMQRGGSAARDMMVSAESGH